MNNKILVIVGGPTASGKTTLALELAKHFDTDIISADSRQFYRQLAIGTAKPTPEELAVAKHHFIDSLNIDENYSAGHFERDALALLDDLYQTKDVVVVAGGSGFFINALCQGFDRFPEVPESRKQEIIAIYQEKGLAFLQDWLKESDPVYYKMVDKNNPQRLMRALAVIKETNQPFSSFLKSVSANQRSFTPVYLQVHRQREELYDRIDTRVDQMMEQGLLAEAEAFYAQKTLNALQTVGYKEIYDYLDKKLTLEAAITKIKQHSRNYAKRQLTWMRKDGFWKHIRPNELELAIDYIELVKTYQVRIQTTHKENILQLGALQLTDNTYYPRWHYDFWRKPNLREEGKLPAADVAELLEPYLLHEKMLMDEEKTPKMKHRQ